MKHNRTLGLTESLETSRPHYVLKTEKKTRREERNRESNLAFREAPYEGTACSLVAAGIRLVCCVCPVLTFTLTAEEKLMRTHFLDLLTGNEKKIIENTASVLE